MRRWNIWKGLILGALMLSLVRCGNEQEANLVPGTGLLSKSGSATQAFTVSNVAIAASGAFTNITLSMTVGNNGGNNTTRTIKIAVPTAAPIGVPFQLDKNSTFTEVTTNNLGGTLFTDFSSTKAKGSGVLYSLSPTSAVGTYQILFTDAANRTRAIFQGTFSFSG